MIRPFSEIEYPPSEAACTKARMIARMESLCDGSDEIVSVIAKRLVDADVKLFAKEVDGLAEEQRSLVENMKKLIKS